MSTEQDKKPHKGFVSALHIISDCLLTSVLTTTRKLGKWWTSKMLLSALRMEFVSVKHGCIIKWT